MPLLFTDMRSFASTWFAGGDRLPRSMPKPGQPPGTAALLEVGGEAAAQLSRLAFMASYGEVARVTECILPSGAPDVLLVIGLSEVLRGVCGPPKESMLDVDEESEAPDAEEPLKALECRAAANELRRSGKVSDRVNR